MIVFMVILVLYHTQWCQGVVIVRAKGGIIVGVGANECRKQTIMNNTYSVIFIGHTSINIPNYTAIQLILLKADGLL